MVEKLGLNRIPICWQCCKFAFLFNYFYALYGYMQSKCVWHVTVDNDEKLIHKFLEWSDNPIFTENFLEFLHLLASPFSFLVVWLLLLPCVQCRM